MSLGPLAASYRAAVWGRNELYDRGVLRVRRGAIPAIAVGNLTVGGTGKTPVSAWIAAELAGRGARPAIVFRGYGNDERLVHERLNPSIPVIVAADRLAGLVRAAAAGAAIAVLDDGFQHRRVARMAEVVLVSAERGLAGWRMLPAGPFREPPSALRRASLMIVTRKTASEETAASVLAAATAISGGPGAIVHLRPAALVPTGSGEPESLAALAGRRVVAITGVGEPDVLAGQLREVGADVALYAFPDHHAFSDREVAWAAAQSARADTMVVCTLKDAVKIAARWPGPGALWYVSQGVTVDQGMEHLERLLEAAVAATRSQSSPGG